MCSISRVTAQRCKSVVSWNFAHMNCGVWPHSHQKKACPRLCSRHSGIFHGCLVCPSETSAHSPEIRSTHTLSQVLQDFLILSRGLCGLINRLALRSDFNLTRGRSSESFFLIKRKSENFPSPIRLIKWQISPATENRRGNWGRAGYQRMNVMSGRDKRIGVWGKMFIWGDECWRNKAPTTYSPD